MFSSWSQLGRGVFKHTVFAAMFFATAPAFAISGNSPNKISSGRISESLEEEAGLTNIPFAGGGNIWALLFWGADQLVLTPSTTKASLTFEPNGVLDADLGSSAIITNLTPWHSGGNKSLAARSFQYVSGFSNFSSRRHDALSVGDSSKGIRVTRSRRLEVGAGASLVWYARGVQNLSQRLFGAAIGVLPSVGTDISSVQYAANKSAAEKLADICWPPMKASDVDALKINEQVRFLVKGSLLFAVGLGTFTPSANTMAMATGTWQIDVKKMTATQALVKVTRDQMDSYWLSADGLITGVNIGDFANRDRQFSFAFDMKNTAARRAYEDLLKGNVFGAQNVAQLQKTDGIHQIGERKNSIDGSAWSVNLGIPAILQFNFVSGNAIRLVENVRTNVKVNHGVAFSVRESSSLLGGSDRTENYFISTVFQSKRTDTQGFIGEFSWRNEVTSGDDFALQRSLQALQEKTGLKDAINVNIPKNDSLGNVRVMLKVLVPQRNWELAARNLSGGQLQKLRSQLAQVFANTYPRKCSQGEGQSLCMDSDEYLEGLNAVDEMIALLPNLTSAGNSKNLAQKLAVFAQRMMTNQISFQAGLAMLGAGTMIRFQIYGANLSTYEIVYSMRAHGELRVVKAPLGSVWQSRTPKDHALESSFRILSVK